MLRPYTAFKLSLRLPPLVDGGAAARALKALLEDNAPYNAKVTFHADGRMGARRDRLERAAASRRGSSTRSTRRRRRTSARRCGYIGQGGTIPLMSMLRQSFPKAQMMVCGVLGPKSNAHGPNEFLHVPYGKKLTAAVAQVIGGLPLSRGGERAPISPAGARRAGRGRRPRRPRCHRPPPTGCRRHSPRLRRPGTGRDVRLCRSVAARDAHRRRGAGLDAGQHRVGHREAGDLPVERRQRLADRRDRVVGQAAAGCEIGQAHARLCRTAARCRSAVEALAREEVADQLSRRLVVAAAELEGARFPVALEGDAGERARPLG